MPNSAGEMKKRFYPIYGTKAFHFCDTTQIGVLENAHSLAHTIICAPVL